MLASWKSIRPPDGSEVGSLLPVYGWKPQMPTYVYQSCLFVRRQIEKSLTLRESFLAERAKFLINTHYETNQLNSEIYNGMHSDEIRKVWNGKQLGFWRSLVAQAVRTFSPEKQQTILTKLDHLQKNGVSHAGTLFPGGFWDSFTDAKKKKLFQMTARARARGPKLFQMTVDKQTDPACPPSSGRVKG